MISEKLSGIYTKIEDKYFDALDFLDSKGIPVFKYSDFFENKGIPSFVVTVAIIIAIIVLLTVAVGYHGGDVGQLTLSLKDADGKSLNGVQLAITDEAGNTLFEGKASDGETVNLSRTLYNGERITIEAEASGFAPKTIYFTIGTMENAPRLSFEKQFEGAEAMVRVIDAETKTIVFGASVIASSNSLSYQLFEDANGVYKKQGVPQGTNLSLKVSAEGYNEYTQIISFTNGQVREVQLAPSSASYAGIASVQVQVVDETGKLVNGATVKIYDKSKDAIVLTNVTTDGSVVGSVQAGVGLRVTVEKEGYLTYDSENEGGSITIRKSEAVIKVQLKTGGQSLHVSVVDEQTGFALEGAVAQLYKEDGTLIASAVTSTSGVDFNGLNPADTIIVAAHKESYLAGRKTVALKAVEQVQVPLKRVTANNSARLDIYAIGPRGEQINGVKVQVFDLTDGNRAPYGIPAVETSFAGYIDVTVERGKTYELLATNEIYEGTETIEVLQTNTDKKVLINLEKKKNIFEIHFIDVFGKDIEGTAVISSLDGATLFDGTLSLGRAFFDAQQKSVVEVMVSLPDGNTFTENVTTKGRDFAEVLVYSRDPNDLEPAIDFVGLENENGETVQGITPGAFYWAKFSVTYPRAASLGGVHFRTGADNISSAESETTGIYDLSFQNASITYSNSYTPAPSPGNEAVDRANTGTQGEKNKWTEGTISTPVGTYSIKVKLRVEDFTPGKIALQYRAWAVVDSNYFRSPADSMLGQRESTSEKSGLYAVANTQSLTLYQSLPDCTGTICINSNFVDESEKYYASAGFEAIKGKQYALEIEVATQEQDYIQLTVTSDSNIDFSSTQTSNFGFAVQRDAVISTQKSASTTVSLAKEGKQKVRFYFTAGEEGSAKITVSADGKSSVAKDLLFNVVQEKTLLVELSESRVLPGRNFTVKVTDTGLKGIDNALVKIIGKEGTVTKSTLGDGTEGNGKNGFYRIQNNLSPGLYTVEVSVQNYKTQAVSLLIAIQDILAFPDIIEAKIDLGQKSVVVEGTLSNRSDFYVQDIAIESTTEAEKDNTAIGQSTLTDSSGKISLRFSAPLALGSQQNQPIQITVNYLGEADDSVDETINATISGMVEGKFFTKVNTQIHVVYNRKLDPACLVIDPSNVLINVLGTQGTTDSKTVEITNNCGTQVLLKKRVREKTPRSLIALGADETIDLQPGEAKMLTISANNLVDRVSAREENYSFELVYDSNYLKKTINVSVRTINPALSLSYPRQVTMWLAQGSLNDKATAAQPVFITNTSSFPVENITLNVSNSYLNTSNVRIMVQPPAAVSLMPGQAITPAKVLYATANTKLSEPAKATIEILGRMGQLNNNTGQLDRYNNYTQYLNGQNYSNAYGYGVSAQQGLYSQTPSLNNYAPSYSQSYNGGTQLLGLIDVTIFYSGYDCLRATLASDAVGDPFSFYFPEGGGQSFKYLSITNTCSEPVRLTGALPAAQAKSQLTYSIMPIASSVMMSLPPMSVSPGQTVQVPMTVITANARTNLKNYQIVVAGVSEISQTLINTKPFAINIYSGVTTGDEHFKGTKIELNICGAGDKKESVTVPKIASGMGCSDGYCDAKNAANFIAERIRASISKAQSAGYSKKDQGDEFSCQSQGACTFDELGVPLEQFDLYLQNDDLSAAVLEKALNSTAYEGVNTTPYREAVGAGTGFAVQRITVDAGTLSNILRMQALSGYDRIVFLDKELSGCGYYRIAITGAVGSSPTGLNAMTPVVAVRVLPVNGKYRLDTKECRVGINNIVNFNPIDEGYTPSNDYGTWLTTVSSDSQLQTLAKSVADARFKKGSERYASGNGNKIVITRGSMQGVLAQMCVSGTDRKTITVKVDDSLLPANADAKTAFNQQIVSMVSDALSGSFGNNCVVKEGDNYTCVNLTESGAATQRRLNLLSNKMLFTSSAESCVSGTVYSNWLEPIKFNLELQENKKNFVGVKQITISTDDSLAVPIAASAANRAANQQLGVLPAQGSTELVYKQTLEGAANFQTLMEPKTIQLKPNPSKSDYKFYRNIKICASPTTDGAKAGTAAYVQANGNTFAVAVYNGTVGLGEPKAEEKQVITIQTGSMHPEDLAQWMCRNWQNAIDKPYYFTLNWASDGASPETFQFDQYINGLKSAGKLETCVFFDAKTGQAGTNAADTLDRQGRQAGLTGFAGACFASSLACNTMLKGPAGGAAAAFDCIIPLATVYKNDVIIATQLDRSDTFKGFRDFLEKIPVAGKFLSNLLLAKQEEPQAKTLTEQLYPSALSTFGKFLTTPEKARLLAGIGETGFLTKRLTNGAINSTSQELAGTLAEAQRNQFRSLLKGSGTTIPNNGALSRYYTKLEEKVGEALKKELSAKINAAAEKKGIFKSAITYNQYVQPEVKGSMVEILKDIDVQGIVTKASDDVLASKSGSGITLGEEILGSTAATGPLTTNDLLARFPNSPKVQTIITGPASSTNLEALINEELRGYSSVKPSVTPPAPTNVINSTINGGVSATAAEYELAQDITVAQARDAARKAIAKAGLGLNATQIDAIVASIDSTPPGGPIYSPKTIGGSNKLTTVVAKDIEAALRPGLTKGITTTEITALSQKLAQQSIKSASEDELKAALKTSKWQRAMSGTVKIAKSLGCGILANAIGAAAYNSAIASSQKEINAQGLSNVIPDQTLVKGETYKLTLTKVGTVKIAIEPVSSDEKLKREMELEIGKRPEALLTSATNDKAKPPEERPLDVWYLQTNLITAKHDLPLLDYPYAPSEIAKQIEIMQDPKIQKMIYYYTSPTDVLGKPNGKYITGADEALAISIMLYGWNDFSKQASTEIKNNTGWLEGKLRTAMQQSSGAGRTGQQLASALFPGISQKNAQTFDKMYTSWQAISLRRSPQGTGIAVTASAIPIPVTTTAQTTAVLPTNPPAR